MEDKVRTEREKKISIYIKPFLTKHLEIPLSYLPLTPVLLKRRREAATDTTQEVNQIMGD